MPPARPKPKRVPVPRSAMRHTIVVSPNLLRWIHRSPSTRVQAHRHRYPNPGGES